MTTKLRFLFVLCCTFVSTIAPAQTTCVWTGGGDGTNIDQAANWGGIAPNAANGDTGQFNGVQPGNLSLNYSSTVWSSGPGFSGVNLHLTSNQVSSVALDNFSSNLNPPNLALYNITIDSGAGAFSWGASNNKRINCVARPAGAAHSFVNNSSFPATVGNQILWVAGGGASYTIAFSGTGDWNVNNYLQSAGSSAGVGVQVNGPGTMTWTPSGFAGSDNILSVHINGGTLVLAAPHPKLIPRAITNDSVFRFDAPSQVQALNGGMAGTGALQVNGGTLTLGGVNTYTGPTTVSNGTLVVSGGAIAGSLFLEGGAIATAPAGTVAALNVAGNMNINSGTVLVALNKTLSPSNTLFTVGTNLSAVSGSVVVTNAGPPLQTGDTFTLFKQPVVNGQALTITGGGAGVVWTNNLALNGSITVLTVPPPPPTLAFSRVGDDMQFSWTNGGFKLQAQTNTLGSGLDTNWADVPGGGSSPVIVPMGITNEAVFFRLAP